MKLDPSEKELLELGALGVNKVRNLFSKPFFLRARFLFVLPVPLFFMGMYSLFAGDFGQMLARFSSLGLYLFAARQLLEGEKAALEFNSRQIAKPPAFPRKLLASVTTGVATAVMGLFGFVPMMEDPNAAIMYSLAAGALHSFIFGLDPMRPKGLEGYSELEAKRLLEALERGQQLLSETLRAARSLPNSALQQRVERSMVEAGKVLVAIEKNPDDLQRARKFMMVYLQGARDATVKLADLSRKDPEAWRTSDYDQLLRDLETRFIQQREKLVTVDRSDLDVEVEVLRDRIKQDL